MNSVSSLVSSTISLLATGTADLVGLTYLGLSNINKYYSQSHTAGSDNRRECVSTFQLRSNIGNRTPVLNAIQRGSFLAEE